jgi:ribosome-associated heat shock protein Hsp15
LNVGEKTVIRLDKWLWAARFYKTRNLAKQAVEGGKVFYNGQRVKVSKAVEQGAEIRLRQGLDEKTVKVLAVSEQRRGAPEAQLLYEELPESIQLRQQQAEIRRQTQQHLIAPPNRPSKKARRQIHSFKEQHRE